MGVPDDDEVVATGGGEVASWVGGGGGRKSGVRWGGDSGVRNVSVRWISRSHMAANALADRHHSAGDTMVESVSQWQKTAYIGDTMFLYQRMMR